MKKTNIITAVLAGICSMHGGDKICMQNFCLKT
jgi:hypothetical protein